MNPPKPPPTLTPEALAQHEAMIQSLQGVAVASAAAMQPYIDAERARYRQYLKDLENGLRSQGLTQEQYAIGVKAQQERIQNAEAEMAKTGRDRMTGELLINRIRQQTSSVEAETLSYLAEADRLEERIRAIQAQLDISESDQSSHVALFSSQI